jgi:hypothetical protein
MVKFEVKTYYLRICQLTVDSISLESISKLLAIFLFFFLSLSLSVLLCASKVYKRDLINQINSKIN